MGGLNQFQLSGLVGNSCHLSELRMPDKVNPHARDHFALTHQPFDIAFD